ncbi:NADH:flavin oxidoreductase/NADH oxidase [Aggregicoccus sp. 17bor-14]|uniref:NADH:flavin oxidoreductase/NADH oxidase n=1 Tax=Myxococcaceae TaxID=31 RepID=UPI00129C5142|nr:MULTISPECIES: NADH:flavin oxidoreductase/NADH oxidase [Myxococcaceae]MBF5043209.1 NADH:flavin oxidoreductase/NADH oxidase [Simulacricoccus sp. 17bor-14]MRI88966.1 NADH:flavin oxidoreductase/NADH oxidase [Aggregicoccus sp. 17bor-14]
MSQNHLFRPLTLRSVTARNRAWVSPMCQYSAKEGVPQDWHLVHLGSRAVGGAGLILAEATAVSPEGRISPADTGLWNDAQQAAWSRIAAFMREQGAVPGVQLAHAGRKASTQAPWEGHGYVPPEQGGWADTVAPSAIAFGGLPAPRALDAAGLRRVREDFVAATRRALAAGFEVVELHAAHGYLLHTFLSPLSNTRQDSYGGGFDNRVRFPLEVIAAVREAWPERLPLLVRISATDWAEGGWTLEESVELARRMKALGVDLVDCSTGGLVPDARIPVGPGYQVSFSRAVRQGADIPTAAVGMLTEPAQVEQVLAMGDADAVFLARALLRDAYWPQHAARALRERGAPPRPPVQYERAWPRD